MTVDVVIAGNGVLGLSIAVATALRDPALRIAVVGPTARPGSASAAAGAMLNCFAEVTAHTSEKPAFQAKFALAREAAPLWSGWLEQLKEAAGGSAVPVTSTRGTLVVLGARVAQDGVRNMRAIRAAAAEYGEPLEEVDPYGIHFLEASPGDDPVDAFYLEDEGAVDARQVLAALEAAASGLGILHIPGDVASLAIAGNSAAGVRLSSGRTVAAGAVVLAAGAATGRIIDQLPVGMVQPMLNGVGAALEARRGRRAALPHVVRTPALVGGCGFHVVPLGNDVEYLGASNLVYFDPPNGPRLGAVQALLTAFTTQFSRDFAVSTVKRWHYGLRPITLDTFPLIGRSPMPGLFFATGTYRDGFHCSPAISRHLAGLLTDCTTDESGPYALFAPGRKPIETMTVGEAAERFAEMRSVVAVERGMRLPYFIDAELLVTAFRQQAKDSVDRLGSPVALAPEVLAAVAKADGPRIRRVAAYLGAQAHC
ncbi:NAD(P)/FAD-dependent oxidoreductase [Amycolatopsis sp. GA6-003]|uniref:NAD(P)/FAD-dependent oxidoreductase n=1 Tax=Amycolatopsis sp. GA6-003 TaxID=2652444 RepID=UPI0039175A25